MGVIESNGFYKTQQWAQRPITLPSDPLFSAAALLWDSEEQPREPLR